MTYGVVLSEAAGILISVTRPLMALAPNSTARSRRNLSMISRRVMPMYSPGARVLPTSTSRPLGEIIFILRTLRSMMLAGRSNSSTMQSGIAPPQGLQLSIFRSISVTSMPACASVSAAHAPAGPPPTTATRSFASTVAMEGRARATRATGAIGQVTGDARKEERCTGARRAVKPEGTKAVMVVEGLLMEVGGLVDWQWGRG
mmetsp:Transcript_13886/g.35440  ORF Transcript_13886/g.35440 Transcript_13886/m.35440 type:complete len:202 (+) Transcript_13886:974-1579(+)